MVVVVEVKWWWWVVCSMSEREGGRREGRCHLVETHLKKSDEGTVGVILDRNHRGKAQKSECLL